MAKPTDDAATAQPTLEWRIDRARAGMFGLHHNMVAGFLQLAVGGVRTGTFGHGDDEQDVLLRMPEWYRSSTGQLENITIPTVRGGAVPITSVATAELVPGPVSIKHFDRKRVLTAGAEVEPWIRADADVRARFQEKVKTYSFPPDITYTFGGAAEEQEESTAFLMTAFLIAIFTISMVLVIQFHRYSDHYHDFSSPVSDRCFQRSAGLQPAFRDHHERYYWGDKSGRCGGQQRHCPSRRDSPVTGEGQRRV
ncbi:MAG: efflux RND transporter permease subunit [Deltaproteobacteria bacterium]|nr:efflux RND transporter permease subunit [Deltaproteobacteria bacterium]